MNIDAVRSNAFAMPLTSPAFPMGPYRFVKREFFIITYRTDLDRLRGVVPEPLKVTQPVVSYEFRKKLPFHRRHTKWHIT